MTFSNPIRPMTSVEHCRFLELLIQAMKGSCPTMLRRYECRRKPIWLINYTLQFRSTLASFFKASSDGTVKHRSPLDENPSYFEPARDQTPNLLSLTPPNTTAIFHSATALVWYISVQKYEIPQVHPP